MSATVWVAVALVGGAGAVARFLVGAEITRRVPGPFPLGTLVINLGGAFVLGLLTGLALSSTALLIAGTATIGSYTTFSTWMYESERLLAGRRGGLAALNLLGSLLVGLGAAALGRALGAAL